MAGRKETESLKPIDKAILGMVSESPGRNESEPTGGLESTEPRRPSPQLSGEGSMDRRRLTDAARQLRRGGRDSTVTRTRRATGETLLVPSRNRRSKVDRITGDTGKSVEGERVADGSAVAMKRGNARGAKGPCCSQCSNNMGGKGEMTKTPISLQDLRRRLYVKAKAEPTWRFWGLYVHVCKMETLREAYRDGQKQ